MEQKVKKHIVFIALGSNLGDKSKNLDNAIQLIKNRVGEVLKVSSIFKSLPFGFDSSNEFFNSCIKCGTNLPPIKLLEELKAIENEMGRVKTKKGYEDRIIDLDIILFDNLTISTDILTIPHPEYKNRDFVLVPLNEVFDY
jgi:2-amino-4-hydroxy-6-hydroxymethyldihydropteridine diphosphokinase